MSPVTEVDKLENIIAIVEDGKYKGRTIGYADCVISVPLEGFKKVTNIYYNPETNRLVVVYKGS